MAFNYLGGELIGSGGFGTVYKAFHPVKGRVAIKRIPMDDGTITPETINELYALGLLKKTETNRPHPNLTEFHEVFVDGDDVCLVFELCSRNLEAQLVEMPATDAKTAMKDILLGMREMHNHGVMHRDIKPSNILVKDDNGILTFKISDFGLARSNFRGSLSPDLGTAGYQAPEVLLGSRRYTTAIDMWAMGCIFYELLLKKKFNTASTPSGQVSHICREISPMTETTWPGVSRLPYYGKVVPLLANYEGLTGVSDIDAVAEDLLLKMLTVDPHQRISATEALKHPYLNGI